MTPRYDAIVLGAGAAGLFCAATAGQRGRRILLLDHAETPGRKILISGGGRCNFTNLEASSAPGRFLSANPAFARAALARYTPADFLALLARHRIAWHEKTLGQLFCDTSARDILAMLLAECTAGGVDLRLSHSIEHVSKPDDFLVRTSQGSFSAPALVLATGGLSIPKIGATGLAYRLAESFGLRLVTPRPGLVPLTFQADDLALMQPLSGVSLPVLAKCEKTAFRESLLFTHRGLSGPAILQISSYWRQGRPLQIDLSPEAPPGPALLAAKSARPNIELRTALADLLPARLAQALAANHPQIRIGQMRNQSIADIAAHLAKWTVTPSGTEGYAKAEVTLGGIDTADLSQRTMEAKSVPGLFAIGEAVDITGWLGGYNFQWAWASAHAAATALSA